MYVTFHLWPSRFFPRFFAELTNNSSKNGSGVGAGGARGKAAMSLQNLCTFVRVLKQLWQTAHFCSDKHLQLQVSNQFVGRPPVMNWL